MDSIAEDMQSIMDDTKCPAERILAICIYDLNIYTNATIQDALTVKYEARLLCSDIPSTGPFSALLTDLREKMDRASWK